MTASPSTTVRLGDLKTLRLCVCTTLLVIGGVPFGLAQAPSRPQDALPTVRLSAGFRNIEVEVAQSPNERETGLMFRERLAPNAGMLFAFEQLGVQCFWMHNTLLPLTAAFIEDDGTIANLADMKPRTDDSHCSTKPVRYVLEMEQGWFARAGLKAGNRLGGTPFHSPVN